MVNASLVESTQGALHCLEMLILKTCPEIHISCKTDSMAKVPYQLRETHPELMFLDLDNMKNGDMEMVDKFVSADYEVIFVISSNAYALDAIKYGAAGYIIKPVKKSDFVRIVNTALRKIGRKEEQVRDKQIIEKLSGQLPGNNHILGIPTLEGFEFIRIDEIIRNLSD